MLRYIYQKHNLQPKLSILRIKSKTEPDSFQITMDARYNLNKIQGEMRKRGISPGRR